MRYIKRQCSIEISINETRSSCCWSLAWNRSSWTDIKQAYAIYILLSEQTSANLKQCKTFFENCFVWFFASRSIFHKLVWVWVLSLKQNWILICANKIWKIVISFISITTQVHIESKLITIFVNKSPSLLSCEIFLSKQYLSNWKAVCMDIILTFLVYSILAFLILNNDFMKVSSESVIFPFICLKYVSNVCLYIGDTTQLLEITKYKLLKEDT